MATVAKHQRLHLLLANYSPRAATVRPRLALGAFANSRARMTLQLVDESHSADGKGLESGHTRVVDIDRSGALPVIEMKPYAVARIKLLNEQP